jgi:hypothetical protein
MAKSGRPSPGLDEYLYWQEHLENRIDSDLSIDEFCEAEGVSKSTFYRWARRLKDGIPESLKEELHPQNLWVRSDGLMVFWVGLLRLCERGSWKLKLLYKPLQKNLWVKSGSGSDARL